MPIPCIYLDQAHPDCRLPEAWQTWELEEEDQSEALMPARLLRARSKLLTSRRRCEGGSGADDAKLVLSEEKPEESSNTSTEVKLVKSMSTEHGTASEEFQCRFAIINSGYVTNHHERVSDDHFHCLAILIVFFRWVLLWVFWWVGD